jgi:signal peptidase I
MSSSAAPVSSPSARVTVEPVPPAAPVVRRGLPRRLLGLLGTGLLVLCLLVFMLIALGPHLFGYRTATMLTGSMEPGISPGDVVVAVEKPTSEIAVGDVISYRIPVEDHRVETHRVVEVIHDEDGAIAIRTKGDANDNADPWTATLEDDTVWEARAVIPKLGSVIRVLRAPALQHGVVWVAFGVLLLVGLSLIWARDPEDGDDEEHGETSP